MPHDLFDVRKRDAEVAVARTIRDWLLAPGRPCKPWVARPGEVEAKSNFGWDAHIRKSPSLCQPVLCNLCGIRPTGLLKALHVIAISCLTRKFLNSNGQQSLRSRGKVAYLWNEQ